MKKGIITVLGKDQVGIIARICVLLAENGVNILDISQTILDGYFNMIMVVDITEPTKGNEALWNGLQGIGTEMGLEVRLQHAEIFDAMHRI